jgi:hypothetical protein
VAHTDEDVSQEKGSCPLYLSLRLLIKPNMLKSIIILFAVSASVTGCTKFREGECIQHIKDGFIWRITEVRFNKYTMIQEWFDENWALPIDAGDFNPDDGRYVKISCPFSSRRPT